MIDFIENIFKSEDDKLAEQYQEYKNKFPKHKLWSKGNNFIVNSFHRHPSKKNELLEGTYTLENYTENRAKAYYVKRLKEIEQSQKPKIEIK